MGYSIRDFKGEDLFDRRSPRSSKSRPRYGLKGTAVYLDAGDHEVNHRAGRDCGGIRISQLAVEHLREATVETGSGVSLKSPMMSQAPDNERTKAATSCWTYSCGDRSPGLADTPLIKERV